MSSHNRNALKAIGIAAAAPIAAFGAFYVGMNAITELYSKKVWATPEEQKMTLPGDDLVVDPNGEDLLVVTQAKDLDAPLEEVWKHIYQMDTCKAGFYSWMTCERLFGMNVDNAYSVQEMWQGPDAARPGDFWPWGYMAMGAEIADVVPNKYIVWFADSRDPSRAPGSSAMLAPGSDYCIWNWTIALVPRDGGARCRIISRYNIAYGPHTAPNYLSQKLIICQGGAMMTRRMFENLERCARFEQRKSLPLRLVQDVIGSAHADPDDLHKRMQVLPELRWSRDFPRVESVRAPFTEDPNWPPSPGKDYVPPIAMNNAKKGWTPNTPAENNAKAEAKQEALMHKLGMR